MVWRSISMMLALQVQASSCFSTTGRPLRGEPAIQPPLRSGACHAALPGRWACEISRWPLAGSGSMLPARAKVVMGTVLKGLQLDTPPDIKTGDVVRVTATTSFRHLPKKVADSGRFDAKGLVGTVTKAYDEPNLSPNRPIKVNVLACCDHADLCIPLLLLTGMASSRRHRCLLRSPPSGSATSTRTSWRSSTASGMSNVGIGNLRYAVGGVRARVPRERRPWPRKAAPVVSATKIGGPQPTLANGVGMRPLFLGVFLGGLATRCTCRKRLNKNHTQEFSRAPDTHSISTLVTLDTHMCGCGDTSYLC